VRKIDQKPPDTPKWHRWRKDCKAEAAGVAEAVARGEKPNFKQKLYRRKSIKEEWFFSGGAPFHGKCAYCETNVIAYQRGDVEHFRPKGAVTDENDEPVVQRGQNGEIVREIAFLPSSRSPSTEAAPELRLIVSRARRTLGPLQGQEGKARKARRMARKTKDPEVMGTASSLLVLI